MDDKDKSVVEKFVDTTSAVGSVVKAAVIELHPVPETPS